MTHWYLGDTGDVRNQLCLQIAPLPSPRDLPSRQRAFADGVDCPVCLDRMPSPPPCPILGLSTVAVADRRTEGSVKHIQHRIDPDTITALCGHTEGVGRYGADRAWADGVLDDQPQTYTDAVDRGYDCPACLDELKRRRGMTT